MLRVQKGGLQRTIEQVLKEEWGVVFPLKS